MSNSTLESEAAFSSRATELGVTDEIQEVLRKSRVTSFGALAFVSAQQIGSSDEVSLWEAMKDLVGRDLTAAEKIPLRRLWFESATAAMAELKSRMERVDSTEPVRLPIAERVARLEDIKKDLKGINLTSEIEPSHKLVDAVSQMATDQQLLWLPWERLTSRATEVASSKSDFAITFDASGALKLQKKMAEGSCSLSGDLYVRQALQRRAIAFAMCKMCSFEAMERYHDALFQTLVRDPPPGCSYVSMQQVREADKQLFVRIAEETRGALSLRPDGSMPMQTWLEQLKDHPQIQFFMIPKSKPERFNPYGGDKGGKDRGKGKDKTKGKASDKDKPSFQLPEGCTAKCPATKKPICFMYNRSGCKHAKDGKRCMRGLHICWKCYKPHPFPQCAEGGA